MIYKNAVFGVNPVVGGSGRFAPQRPLNFPASLTTTTQTSSLSSLPDKQGIRVTPHGIRWLPTLSSQKQQ